MERKNKMVKKLSSKIKLYKEKYDLYMKLEQMLESKQLYQKYTLSDLHRKIIKRFLNESTAKTAIDLKINRSLIYAIIDKCKELRTIEELSQDKRGKE